MLKILPKYSNFFSKFTIASIVRLENVIPLFAFYYSLPQFLKNHYYSSKPALLFSLSWWILPNQLYYSRCHDEFFQTSSIILAVMMNSSKPALLFSLTWWITIILPNLLYYSRYCNRSLSCQFWLGQIIKNWKHWLEAQNLPVGQSFEKATKVCVLGYIWPVAVIQFRHNNDNMRSEIYFLGPSKVNIIKMPPHPSIILALFLFLDAYYYFQNYSGIMFAGFFLQKHALFVDHSLQ